MRRVIALAFMALGCAADREPAANPGESEAETRAPVVPPPAADSPDASASDSAVAAREPGTADASAPEGSSAAEPPLVLKGVRECSADEIRADGCAEQNQPGFCLHGYCVTTASCSRYCLALAAREHSECRSDPKSCAGVPECVRVMQENNRACDKLRTDSVKGCSTNLCMAIRALPAP